MAVDDIDSLIVRVSPWRTPGRTQVAEPITAGFPFPSGWVRETDHIRMLDDRGSPVPVQALATERWDDGSVRWALLDFQATGNVRDREYTVRADPAVRAPAPAARLDIVEQDEGVTVDTGAARFELRAGTSFPCARVLRGGHDAIDGERSTLTVTDANGRSHQVAVTRVALEQKGAFRSTVRLEGFAGDRRQPLVRVIARVRFVAGSSAVSVAVTIHNPRRAQHPGGFWELGDRGSILLRDASVRIALSSAIARVVGAAELGAAFETLALPLELYQDSSGGDAWRHETHVNRENAVPLAFRGYRLRAGGVSREGLRAAPAFTASHAAGTATIVVERFWQNFPKAIEIAGRDVVVGLWPRQSSDLHELQGGEQKTHRFVLAFGDDPAAADAVWWGREAAAVAAAPEWYARSGAVPFLAPADADRDDRYRTLVNLAIEGDDAFVRKREAIDEYGWRNFGDLYADHENAFAAEGTPIVSHYNNQYDGIAGFAIQFMRTADARWWTLMRDLASHVADIDIYHTDRDKAAYNHGLFWHTFHYVAAGRSTHRSYPRHRGVGGGGPANEHNYATGLRLHWLLTGDPLSREAAIELATWVVDMDDGNRTPLRWLTRAPTGRASVTRELGFHGPGRGAGNSIVALLDGHRITGDRRLLAKAEQLIRRCIHPADDIDALTLLDAEQRWSYVVFLQALGKFLEWKIELGEVDAAYAYARAALLHYARWMASHEYPYLEKPEILEYPTETWAAQDIRKSDVFWFAAGHAAGDERQRFAERAAFFFDYSVSTLLGSATRALARPLVLLLSNGFMVAGARVPPSRPEPPSMPASAFGAPERFVSQRTVAKQRLKMIAIAGAAAAAILALMLIARSL